MRFEHHFKKNLNIYVTTCLKRYLDATNVAANMKIFPFLICDETNQVNLKNIYLLLQWLLLKHAFLYLQINLKVPVSSFQKSRQNSSISKILDDWPIFRRSSSNFTGAPGSVSRYKLRYIVGF